MLCHRCVRIESALDMDVPDEETTHAESFDHKHAIEPNHSDVRRDRAMHERPIDPPTPEDVLAEIDPFLESVGWRLLKGLMHCLVLAGWGENYEWGCFDPLPPSLRGRVAISISKTVDRQSRVEGWHKVLGHTAHASTRSSAPSSLHPDIYRNHSIAALSKIVNILISSGVVISARMLLIEAIISICHLEEKLISPDCTSDNRNEFTIQLDHAWKLVEILWGVGANSDATYTCDCWKRLRKGSPIDAACRSPLYNDPTSYSGRVLDLLLRKGVQTDLSHWEGFPPPLSLISPSTISSPTASLDTLLHLASQNLSVWEVKRLIQLGADVNGIDGYGYTPLHYMVRSTLLTFLSEDLAHSYVSTGTKRS